MVIRKPPPPQKKIFMVSHNYGELSHRTRVLWCRRETGRRASQNPFTPTTIKAAGLLGNTSASVWRGIWSPSLVGRVARIQSDKSACHSKVKTFFNFYLCHKITLLNCSHWTLVKHNRYWHSFNNRNAWRNWCIKKKFECCSFTPHIWKSHR